MDIWRVDYTLYTDSAWRVHVPNPHVIQGLTVKEYFWSEKILWSADIIL